jgi:hypothetical protein
LLQGLVNITTMSDLLDAAKDPKALIGPPPSRIPLCALIPGLLGLIPFWGLALAMVVDTGFDPALGLVALIMYGAVILSFVGALWWGMAVNAPMGAQRNTMFVWSVVPALIGWFATLATTDIGLRMLMAGLALQWLLDSMLLRKSPNLMPAWVFRLRTMLTGGALSALGFAWWQLL